MGFTQGSSKGLIFVQIISFFYTLNCEDHVQCPGSSFLSLRDCFCGVILNSCAFHCFHNRKASIDAEFSITKGCSSYEKSSIDDLRCNKEKSSQLPGQTLLCVLNSNSPFLGYFYENIPIATNHRQYSNLFNQRTRKVQVSPSTYTKLVNSDFTQYKFGSPLIVLNDLETKSVKLPRSIGFGLCTKSVPIKYLVEQDSFCFGWLSPMSCSDVFNPSDILSTILDDGALLIKTSNGIQKLKPSIEFNNPNYTLDLHSKDFTYPSSVMNSSHCQNFTKDVEIRFHWNSYGIINVTIFITLGLMKMENMVLQHYKVNFLMIGSSHLGPIHKTLSIGYRYQDPVLAVYSRSQTGANLTEIVSVGSNTSGVDVSIFQLEAFNLTGSITGSQCNGVNNHAVNFGVDLSYSCRIPIPEEIHSHCDEVRFLIYDFLLESFPSFLHSGENLGQVLQSPSSLVPVINTPFPVKENVTTDYFCSSIPSKVNFIILYIQEHIKSAPVSRIVGSKLDVSCLPMSPKPLQRVDLHFNLQFVNVNDQQKHLPRFRRGHGWDICHGDICWEELLFPLTFYKVYLDVSTGYIMSSVVLFFSFISSYYYLKN